MHPLFDVVCKALEGDIFSMVEEGYEIDVLKKELDRVAAHGSVDALLKWEEELWRRPSLTATGYDEPSDWASISKHFPDPDSHARFGGAEPDLADKVHGGWLGRVVGCQLGKPMEMAWPDECRKALEASGSWPLTDYMKPVEDPERLAQLRQVDGYGKRVAGGQQWARGRFTFADVDDDTSYSLVGLRVLEKHGVEFTSDQAMDTLIEVTPRSQLYAAGLSMFTRRTWGMSAPYTALFGNGSQQSLGAMIRCDPFGWAAPANPALAARMAFEDARGSQVRNGIYSGMFFAIAMADTFAHSNPLRAVRTALEYVPPRSRFAEMVRWTLARCAATPDWEEARDAIFERYDTGYRRATSVKGNHSMPNAALVLMSLHFARGDFGRAICLATMAGMDTDCTAATAGSIMGIATGARGIPESWSRPLHDTLRSQLVNLHEVRVSEVAQRTFQIARRHCRFAGGA